MGTDSALIFDFKGLVTAPGRLARAEASALEAINLVFDAPGVVRKRRGWRRLTQLAAGVPWKIFGAAAWGSTMLLSRGLSAGATALQMGDGTAVWVSPTLPDAGQIRGTSSLRVMGAPSLRSFYLTALDAPVRLEPNAASSALAHYAGMPRGMSPGLFGLAAGTALADGYARGYRVTWHRVDSDGVTLGGPPTGRLIARNQTGSPGYAGVTANAAIILRIPQAWGTDATNLTTEYFLRLWGTRSWNAAAGDQGDDECYLLAEQTLTAGDIATGTVVVVDSTPDTFLLGETTPKLNTNAVDFPAGEEGIQQGIVNADEPPPVAYEVASWQGVTWWADVRYRPQGLLTMLVTGAPTGLQDGDTVTVQIGASTLVMTARAAPAAANEFKVWTTLATTQMNNEATARDFADAFNARAKSLSFGVRAYAQAYPYAQTGTVLLEALRVDTSTAGLQMVSSRATWYRFDSSAAGVGVGYGGEARNAVCFSKPGRADAVPLINRLVAGPTNARVLRLQPFRDRLFVFTDQGVYFVSGRSFADFSIQPFSLDLVLLAREAVCVCDDAVYAWCTGGIARISDGGWEIVSTPIEPTVQDIIRSAKAGNGVPELAFAIGDTAQHRVLFWYPQYGKAGDVNGCAYALVFDTRTSAWSRYEAGKLNTAGFTDWKTHGAIRESDKRVTLGSQRDVNDAEGYLFEERLDFLSTDFADDSSLGSTDTITSRLQLLWQVPDAGGAQHWQQTVLQFDAGELAWRTLPTLLQVDWETETQTGGVSGLVPTKRVLRLEPPGVVRRGNQLGLTINHSAEEYFGLVGLKQMRLIGTKWAGRAR